MVERKSKPRTKKDDDADPAGMEKLKQSPWFILGGVAVLIVLAVLAIFGVARFLSGA